jgi:hypothetical protein
MSYAVRRIGDPNAMPALERTSDRIACFGDVS